MKKVIKLTESDLTRIVKMVLKENRPYKRELKLRNKLNNIFFGSDEYNITSDEGQRGYLSQDYRLNKEISPRQRTERIQQVIDELEDYIQELKYSIDSESAFIQNKDYESIWSGIEKDM